MIKVTNLDELNALLIDIIDIVATILPVGEVTYDALFDALQIKLESKYDIDDYPNYN